MHVPNLLRAMPEKDTYEMMELEKTITESALYDGPSRMYDDPHKITAEWGLQLDEAADMYGDVNAAQEHGYVTRGYVRGALATWMLRLTTTQPQIAPYTIHRPWRYRRYRFVPRYRTSLDQNWTS